LQNTLAEYTCLCFSLSLPPSPPRPHQLFFGDNIQGHEITNGTKWEREPVHRPDNLDIRINRRRLSNKNSTTDIAERILTSCRVNKNALKIMGLTWAHARSPSSGVGMSSMVSTCGSQNSNEHFHKSVTDIFAYCLKHN
jgi:hypothetical protein